MRQRGSIRRTTDRVKYKEFLKALKHRCFYLKRERGIPVWIAGIRKICYTKSY
ncbi:hypothetical protein HOLDEFILI_02339 [Holdemania filiformis DSM 12042]|uniref:Uncharacterized protein n=1 Tax=Holdemania filiformis DSM 12042 TaxID=545696 RepID=B9Y936_9FIRM|nr:hypothetical protein HOLDEFILI_02339 [Holdemania filiformis DSM 12042]